MTKTTHNYEVFMPQKTLRSQLIVAVFISAALLPLSAIAAPIDDKEVEDLTKEINVESVGDVTTISNEGKQESATSDSATLPEMPSANTVAVINQSSPVDITDESNNDSVAIVNDDNTAANTTAALDNIDKLNSANTEKKAVERQPETVEKTPFWQNTDYLLIGGLALLILGGGLLLFRKISGLNAENRNLNQKHNMLTNSLTNTKKQLEKANSKNKMLEADLKEQRAMYDEQTNIGENALGTVLPFMDVSEELPVIEDLNASDRKQLSDSITTWLKTNRGNTKVQDLVSKDIQLKLDYLNYKIELWVGSDGVDSVEPTENTMRAAVISLTKPDRQGFAYCYIKPNALSSTWVNKAWYKVQRTNSTLEVLGEPLEIN